MTQNLPGNPQHVAIIGTQWGDEGKGKLVDILAADFDYVCRSVGGANAGHTIVVQDKKYVFHLLPSGLLHDKPKAVIGAGTVVNIPSLAQEIQRLKDAGIKTEGRVLVASNAQLIFEYHKLIDAEQENRKGANKIGTTCRGIGPCYADKANRIGIRMEDLKDPENAKKLLVRNAKLHSDMYGIDIDAEYEWSQIEPHLEALLAYTSDVSDVLIDAAADGKKILFEGAQAHHLDLDHGTYPYVTSSNVSVGGFVTGLGVPPQLIEYTVGIAKAYTTRVGGGPFITELTNELGQQIRDAGHEYGSTTGRPRRCGWFDAVAVKDAVRKNGIHSLCLTKLDVLTGISKLDFCTAYGADNTPEYITLDGWTEDISGITDFDALPANAKAYVKAVETYTGCPVSSIGTGPGRAHLIVRSV